MLGRPKFAGLISHARQKLIMAILRDRAVWWSPAIAVTDCRDATDNKYLERALAADAKTIVSGDEDLLVPTPWRGVRILKPADYLAVSQPP